MTLIFRRYAVEDAGVRLWFESPDPGANRPSDYDIVLTDTELATITTQAQLRTMVQSKLERKLRAAGVASRLDPFIGQSLTVA